MFNVIKDYMDISEKPAAVPTREQVIEAFKKAFEIVPARQVGSSDAVYGFAYTDKIPEFEKADRLYDKWRAAEEANFDDMSEAGIESRFNDLTIFWDAGKDGDPYYLDELANDWIVQDEDKAREKGFTELADRMKQKMDEINQHLDHG